MTVSIKRIYEDASPQDGVRVLVDRLWPRGVRKADAKLDEWLKGVGPSNDLRKWFNHDAARFEEFSKKYRGELQHNDAVAALRKLVAEHPKVTLLYGAHDEEHNQAVVLRDFL